MNKKVSILTAKNAFITTLFLVAVGLAFLAPRAAVNVDEQLHYPHAKKVVNWYFTGGDDTSCLETPETNLKYYGQSVDNLTALVNRVFNIENEFLVRHFTGAVFFWLLLFFAGLITCQISGSYWGSVITVISMVFMPRLFGHAFGNLKDIPFATGYIAGIYMIFRFIKELPRPHWSTAVLLGLSIAFTCSIRIGGLILFAYLALFVAGYLVWRPFVPKQIVSSKPCLVRLMGQATVIVLTGYFAGLLFWPFALQDVFAHPLESLGVMEHYKVSIRQIFEGKLLWSTQLPWYYLPKWVLISTPEFIWAGVVGFALFFTRDLIQNKEKTIPFFFEILLIFTFLFPVVYVILIQANLYSGERQMIFVLPLLAIFTSVAAHRLLKSNFSKFIKTPIVGVFIVLMIFPLKHQVSTFPADYIYFNSLAGGNKKAWGNYEYDYYFHGLKKPAEYLVEMVKNEKNITVATNCLLTNYFDRSPNIAVRYVRYPERSSEDWDYGLFGVNYIHPDLLKNETWLSSQAIKTFYHKGNPIAVLLKRSDKKDFEGIDEIAKGNFDVGEKFLKQAVEEDVNNVWLFVNLAKVCLIRNDIEGYDFYIKKGRLIYPFYEPFYLLEAQKLFSENRFAESYQTLQTLAEISPRYKPAEPLIEAVKEKLNK